jgi:hypothetical protein
MTLPARINKTKLVKGLNTLSRIWKRRLVPDDLEKHYMLYWFLACGGNILETARHLNIHRNTIQGYFLRFKYSKKAVKLRHAWRQLNARFPRRTETDLFNRFYHRFGLKPSFSVQDNQGLVTLWNAGFPMKVLKAHYLLWASRSDKSRAWIESRLEFSNRHQLRIYGQIGRLGTRENFWLKPLNPKRDEWYLPRYRKTARKRKSKR